MIRIKTSTCEWMRRSSLILTIMTFVFFWFDTFGVAKQGVRWRDISDAGVALWIFLIAGAVIILLQLIPALLMFFSFVGTGTHIGYKVVDSVKDETPATETVREVK